MLWEHRIITDPGVMGGKPVVKGTRLTVDFIIDLLAGGTTEADLLRNYPRLTIEDIRACLAYASELVRLVQTGPLPA